MAKLMSMLAREAAAVKVDMAVLVALLAREAAAVKVLREDHFANVRKLADNELTIRQQVRRCARAFGLCVRVTPVPRLGLFQS